VDEADDKWEGSTGFVDAEMLKKHLPAAASDTQVLMCGPPAMMEKAVKPALETLGFTKDSYMEF
jgi:NAD(P)H-flavin reductase